MIDLNYQKSGDLNVLDRIFVLERFGPVTYKIELPPSRKSTHSVFHLSKLKRFVENVDSSHSDTVINADGDVQQSVSEVLDYKRNKKIFYYKALFHRTH